MGTGSDLVNHGSRTRWKYPILITDQVATAAGAGCVQARRPTFEKAEDDCCLQIDVPSLTVSTIEAALAA